MSDFMKNTKAQIEKSVEEFNERFSDYIYKHPLFEAVHLKEFLLALLVDEMKFHLLTSQRKLLLAVVEDLEEKKINDDELGLGREYDKALSEIQSSIKAEIEKIL